MSGPQPPFLVVIAGSNGAGKSTWTAAGRVPAGIPVLDPDAIARALRPDAPHLAAVQAGREALRLQRAYVAERRSFAVETTLSGSSILRLMVEARNQGFGVELLYVASPCGWPAAGTTFPRQMCAVATDGASAICVPPSRNRIACG